jgi:hypothetical protein
LGRLEGNGGFRGALRTDGPGFCADASAGSGHTLDFALLATFWIVLELLIVKEQLLTGGKDKVVTAIGTFQYLVDEVHTRPPEHALELSVFRRPSAGLASSHQPAASSCYSTTFLTFAQPGNERGNDAKPLQILEECGIADLTHQ